VASLAGKVQKHLRTTYYVFIQNEAPRTEKMQRNIKKENDDDHKVVTEMKNVIPLQLSNQSTHIYQM
jgi:hypothetical protein